MAKEIAQDVSKEQRALLLFQPYMIGLAFSLKHIKAGSAKEGSIAKDPGLIACTNGTTIWYGENYDKCEQPEKNFIYLHELMHGVFRHSDRTLLIMLQRGSVNALMANIAADAIINEGIKSDSALHGAQFSMPKAFPGITMAVIHEMVGEVIKIVDEPVISSYDPKALGGQQMEVIYDWLMWALEAMKRHREKQPKKKGKNQKGEGSPQDSNNSGGGQSQEKCEDGKSSNSNGEKEGDESEDKGQGSGKKPGKKSDDNQEENDAAGNDNVPDDETKIEKMNRTEKAWDLDQAIEEMRRLLDEGVTLSELIEKCNASVTNARGNIQSIIQGLKMQGVGQGNMLLSLENDLPPPVVPWNKFLRKVIHSGLGTKLNDSYTRLGSSARSAMALRLPTPYQPGTTIFSEKPRILVAPDVSGSHIDQLDVCFAEIWSIVRMKNAAIDVVTFDWGVQEKMEIKNRNDFRKILAKGIQGGGGTDLDNMFEEVKKMRDPYKVIVVMTDGYINAPKDTKGMEIVWMITPGGSSEGLEGTGTIINIPDYMGEKKAA